MFLIQYRIFILVITNVISWKYDLNVYAGFILWDATPLHIYLWRMPFFPRDLHNHLCENVCRLTGFWNTYS